MSARHDIIVGIDVSSLSSVTQEQLVQMVNEAAPLSDIGFCLFGTTTPDVANNPRFARYIWLDTSSVPPVPKFYNSDNGTWVVGSTDLTDLSIVAIQEFIDTYGVYIQNVHVKADFTADAAQGYFIARAKANGKDCELVDLPTALTDGGNVPIGNIQTNTASDKTFLVTDVVAGVKTASWRTFAPATDINNGQLPLAKLAAGTAGYIPQMVGGVPVWVDPTTVISGGGEASSMRVKNLITSKDGNQVDGGSAPYHAATQYQVPIVGADLTPYWQTPPFSQFYEVTSGVFVTTLAAVETGFVEDFAMPVAWTKAPRFLRVVLVSGTYGVDGLELDIACIYRTKLVSATSVNYQAFSSFFQHSNKTVRVTYTVGTSGLTIQSGSGSAILQANTHKIKIYAAI
jgi:hypothetical protein